MQKTPYRLFLAGLLAAAQLFAEDEAAPAESSEVPAAEAVEEALVAEMPAPEAVEVSDEELIKIVGYLTAQGGGVPSLQLEADGIEALAEGLKKGLSGELNIMEFDQEEMQAAFGQAQARAEAAQAESEELPEISLEALEKIGAVIVMQSGLAQLGFGTEEADLIKQGFAEGAAATEPDPSLEAKMPAFQEFIQGRMQIAQAKMMEAQQAAQKAAMAEFEDVAAAWRAKDNFNVVLKTTQGDVTIELFPSVAPLAVANFVGHIENDYYDGLIFHRVIKDFMIQGGDPNGTGMGGESIWGKNFPDEFSDEVRFDQVGLLAMANSGPMTNGSQFFITTSMPEWLNDKHTIFGKVVEGYENVQAIEGVETGEQDKPVENQKIIDAYVAE